MIERPMTDSERQELPKIAQAVNVLPELYQKIIVAQAEMLVNMQQKGVDLSPLYEENRNNA